MSNDVFGFGLSSTAEVVALDWPLDVHCPSSREREREREIETICALFLYSTSDWNAWLFSFLFFSSFFFFLETICPPSRETSRLVDLFHSLFLFVIVVAVVVVVVVVAAVAEVWCASRTRWA